MSKCRILGIWEGGGGIDIQKLSISRPNTDFFILL